MSDRRKHRANYYPTNYGIPTYTPGPRARKKRERNSQTHNSELPDFTKMSPEQIKNYFADKYPSSKQDD